jgi:hypothetical protein
VATVPEQIATAPEQKATTLKKTQLSFCVVFFSATSRTHATTTNNQSLELVSIIFLCTQLGFFISLYSV